MKRSFGFTLLELMIVVTIMAILAAFAYSSYQNQLRKSRRAEAKQVLADYAGRQEKWRNNHTTYGSLTDINGSSSTPNGYYTITVSFPASGTCPSGVAKGNKNSYVLTATKAGLQAADTACATLVLTSDCGVVSKTSTPAGNVCW